MKTTMDQEDEVAEIDYPASLREYAEDCLLSLFGRELNTLPISLEERKRFERIYNQALIHNLVSPMYWEMRRGQTPFGEFSAVDMVTIRGNACMGVIALPGMSNVYFFGIQQGLFESLSKPMVEELNTTLERREWEKIFGLPPYKAQGFVQQIAVKLLH